MSDYSQRHHQSAHEWELKQVTDRLVGGTIIAAIEDPPGAEHDGYFGFQVLLKSGRTLNVWVNCDPEGNGPEHLNLEEQS